jgi:glycyl-tRNA synthetase beta chain
MRWGVGEEEFVRPVHWVVLLFSDEVIPGQILGIEAGRTTRGHRFHHPKAIDLKTAADYADVLKNKGKVIADFETRRRLVLQQVEGSAAATGGRAVIDPELLDEVTALVEWPTVISGAFDPTFLEIPAEVLIATMKDQQRYFHVIDSDGRLLPRFITVANIESRNPETVRRGNERVVTPRLRDAEFFWNQDRATPLAARRELLREVIFQKQLGSLFAKTERTAKLAVEIAVAMGGEPRLAQRAAELSKCDLLSKLVGEFPTLQGVMGGYYARHDGEDEEVAVAINEHYLPRYAGDRLPVTQTGIALGIADKIDTLVGVFGIGQAPSGDRDPFALRRAALGTLRSILENRLDLDLAQLLNSAARHYEPPLPRTSAATDVYDFMMERLRGYLLDDGVSADAFEAVLARRPESPYDFQRRVEAVGEFRRLPESESLAAAYKRISNLLKQAPGAADRPVDVDLLQESAELSLAQALGAMEGEVRSSLERRDYTGALRQLAGLRTSVDRFFDHVMVLTEDRALRENRVALLRRLAVLFSEVADISRLHAK